MLKFMFITNDPQLASDLVACGVDRIFVDLETRGKRERQGHRDTHISHHIAADIDRVRAAIGNAELLVRVNPWYEDSEAEIKNAMLRGADIVMLPMARTMDEIRAFRDAVGSGARGVPMIETRHAAESIEDIARLDGVDEYFIGLNDLHQDMGCRFIFEPLTNGLIDQLAECFRRNGKAFGFGGIARIREGLVPGELVLSEHVRLGSSSVILSRTFHRADTALEGAFRELKAQEIVIRTASRKVIETNRQRVVEIVDAVLRPGCKVPGT